MSAPRSPPKAPAASDGERVRLERGWRMVDEARALFAGALPEASRPASWRDARRGFTAVDYLSLLLIGLFNPAVRTLRGLCKATTLPRLQHQWHCRPMPLASVSDAQHLVDPAVLLPVIGELSERVQAEAATRCPDARSARARMAGFALQVVDSSVLPALPRMLWAAYGGGRARSDGRTNTAVRFHLNFDVSSASPAHCEVTAGKVCERKVWRTMLAAATAAPEQEPASVPRTVHLGDRNYGSDFTLLEELTAKGLHFLVRLRISEHPNVREELSVSAEDRAQGIVRQAWVHLGGNWRQPRRRSRQKKDREKEQAPEQDTPPAVRVIWIEREDQMVVLATDLPVQVLSAALAGEMYRQRWQVEFFFRWMKCLLGCGHWLAESQSGVTLQLYLVMVAALLLQLRCGRRPTKRMLELLHFYFEGLASAEDLARGLERAAMEADKAAKSKRLYAQKMAAQKK